MARIYGSKAHFECLGALAAVHINDGWSRRKWLYLDRVGHPLVVLSSLVGRGFAERRTAGTSYEWRITDAGRTALTEAKAGERK